MPVASSSRRRANTRIIRQPSADEIEEDNPTQRDGGMDDSDEEQQPRRKPKKEKKTKLANGSPEKDAQEGDDVNGDEVIDYEHYPDQPLVNSDAAKIKGLTGDWSLFRKSIHLPSFETLKEVAIAFADTAEGDEAVKGLLELENIMKKMIDIDQEMISHETALDDIYQLVFRRELVSDAVKRYIRDVESKADEYSKLTARKKYAKNEHFISFKQGIHDVFHPDTPMPPVTESIPKEDGDDSEDDDVEIGGVTQDHKCPLTLTTLENPMTAPCGHTFSENAIKEYLKDTRGPRKCPGAGCNKSFTLSQLKPNPTLAKSIRLAQRRARRSVGDMDVDEVVE